MNMTDNDGEKYTKFTLRKIHHTPNQPVYTH